MQELKRGASVLLEGSGADGVVTEFKGTVTGSVVLLRGAVIRGGGEVTGVREVDVGGSSYLG